MEKSVWNKEAEELDDTFTIKYETENQDVYTYISHVNIYPLSKHISWKGHSELGSKDNKLEN